MINPIVPKNKKAQIFTIIALSLIVLMFASFEVYSYFREKKSTKERVETMDSFLHSIETNLERQMYTAGFRITFLALKEKILKRTYVNNIQAFFEEAYFNGTVDNINQSIMIGATHNALVASVNSKAAKINVNISMENTNITVNQTDPWHIEFIVSTDFVMMDVQGLALWRKTQKITTHIPIDRFEEPLYVKSTDGLSRKPNKTIYEGTYNESGDLTNLTNHINGNYYAANPDAPSFLNRLQGDFSKDIYGQGIETFVDITYIQSEKPDLDLNDFGNFNTKSVIDYIFFNPADSTIGNSVPGLNSKYKIDDGHKAKYQLN